MDYSNSKQNLKKSLVDSTDDSNNSYNSSNTKHMDVPTSVVYEAKASPLHVNNDDGISGSITTSSKNNNMSNSNGGDKSVVSIADDATNEAERDDDSIQVVARRTLVQLHDWYGSLKDPSKKNDNQLEILMEIIFRLKEKGVTLKSEAYCGFIHFISCLYVLIVIPTIAAKCGYDRVSTTICVSLLTGFGSIVSGIITNLPFVISPVTVITIYLSSFLIEKFALSDTVDDTNNNFDDARNFGCAATFISGLVLCIFTYRPLHVSIGKLIPLPIQVGTAIGIGLLTCLAGAVEIDLVEQGGTTKLLSIGRITPLVCIAISGVAIVFIGIYHRVKGTFCIALIFCTLVWWIDTNSWPASISGIATIKLADLQVGLKMEGTLSLMGKLVRNDKTTPRSRWLFLICGVCSMVSGALGSVPILITPEAAAGIKAGAKTGISAIVCGCLYLVSALIAKVFSSFPIISTSPILICIGVMLFVSNVDRIDWHLYQNSLPAFMVLFFIPFTYDLLSGIVLGYIFYCIMHICCGSPELLQLIHIATPYVLRVFPSLEVSINSVKEYLKKLNKSYNEHEDDTISIFSVYDSTNDSNCNNEGKRGSNESLTESHNSIIGQRIG